MLEPSDVIYELVINKQRLTCLLEDLEDEVIQRLFGIYKAELTEKVELMSGYLKSEKFEALECDSHALKSASQNLGLDQMGEIMATIEEAAIERDVHKARSSFQQALTYHDLIKALERLGPES